MKKFIAIAAAVAALAFTTGPASAATAKGGVNVGSLNCTVEGGIGMILGSSKGMTCVFSDSSGRKSRYTGRINKLGIDIGVTTQGYITWAVFAPGSIKRGALAGSYGGASAEATIAVGLGANVLVGGSKKSIALQPVSISGQTGLNVAVGISSLTLKSAK
ncbi:DUF992 domain-containing protein [soil metagenome]